MKVQTLIVPVEWKAADDDENTMEGYASTFGNIDLQHDVIVQGAFKNTLPRVKAGDVPYLADHRASVRDVLGTLVDASEDGKGLKIKVKFATDADAQAIRQKMMDGHVKKMSIGYEPLQWRYETRGTKRVRVLEDVRLWEVSAVVFPANPRAVIQTVKSAVKETVDAVLEGAVASGGDEREIKAAIAEWAKSEPVLSPEDAASAAGTGDRPAEKAGCPCPGTKGARLAAALNRAIEARVTDDRSRSDVIAAMGQAAGIEAGTVNQILAGSINCPPLARLRGFARALNVSADTLTAAARRDGCQYDSNASSTDTTHLETGDAGTPEGAEPGKGTETGPTSLTLAMHRADAVLAGRDPDAVADPVTYAGTSARLDALDEWVKERNREAELTTELSQLRGR